MTAYKKTAATTNGYITSFQITVGAICHCLNHRYKIISGLRIFANNIYPALKREPEEKMKTTVSKSMCVAALGMCLSMAAVVPAAGATLSTNADWTWMKGATNVPQNQNGTCGTQGVPDPTHTTGGRA